MALTQPATHQPLFQLPVKLSPKFCMQAAGVRSMATTPVGEGFAVGVGVAVSKGVASITIAGVGVEVAAPCPPPLSTRLS